MIVNKMTEQEPEPGQEVCTIVCPRCQTKLEIVHGEDEGFGVYWDDSVQPKKCDEKTELHRIIDKWAAELKAMRRKSEFYEDFRLDVPDLAREIDSLERRLEDVKGLLCTL